MIDLRYPAALAATLLLATAAHAQTGRAPAPDNPVATKTSAVPTAAERRATAEALQRDIDDLKAQQSMAKSANNLLAPSWWQVWVGLGGLIGLFASLGLNIKSVWATQSALRDQRETSRHQLRAYVGIEKISVDAVAGKKAVANLVAKNFGQTPAYRVTEEGTIKLRRHGAGLPTTLDSFPAGATINPGDTSLSCLTDDDGPLTPADMTALALGDVPGGAVLVVIAVLTYETMGETHKVHAAGEFWGFSGSVENEMLLGQNWAD